MIGIIFGAFDLLHPGHLYTLKRAKLNCDELIVALHVNPKLENRDKHKPVETVFERYLRLMACIYVDQIIPYETEKDVENILRSLPIDIRFNGEDHANKEVKSERDKICEEEGIKIVYIPRKHSWSSSYLRSRL